ncbi:MAG: threonine ammonia-lyase [Thermomicrobiales bacterium]
MTSTASTIATERADVPWQIPTLHDVYVARATIAPYFTPTPLIEPWLLKEELGCTVYVKCESLTPIGAFKLRGGINLLAQMSDEERARGIVTASTGNHGQSIAYASRLFGARAIIYGPEAANPDKVRAMRALGADVVLYGKDIGEFLGEAQRRAAAAGMRFVHPANEPLLIAGVATYTLEILEAVPDLDVLIVPLGGGSGVSGASVVTKAINPAIRVIGVQAAGAPAVYESWRAGRMLSFDAQQTFAEGLATREAFALPFAMRAGVDDVVLVSEEEMRQAILLLLRAGRLLAEGAGAAATAAAMKMRDELAGKKVAVILSGGNLTLDTLRHALTDPEPWA